MGGIISRLRSDPYGATYERHLENIEKECRRLQDKKFKRKRKSEQTSRLILLAGALLVPTAAVFAGWVHRQPPGTYTWPQHVARVAPVVVLPLLLWLLHMLLGALATLSDRWDQAKLGKMTNVKRKMIKDLKDSTRYERIHELINKYDPDKKPAQQPMMPARPARPMQRGSGSSLTPVLAQATGNAAAVAASAAGAAGKALLPLIDKMATFVGDNPVLVDRLREVRCQLQEAELKAQAAAAENERLAARVVELEGQLGISSAGVVEGASRRSSEGERAGAGGLVRGSSGDSDGGGAAMKDMTNMAAEAAGRAGAELGQAAGGKAEEGDGGVRQRKKGAAAQ